MAPAQISITRIPMRMTAHKGTEERNDPSFDPFNRLFDLND